jgi:hypothetical protein
MAIKSGGKASCLFAYPFLRKNIFCFQAMGRIHAIESDGTLVTDVEVLHSHHFLLKFSSVVHFQKAEFTVLLLDELLNVKQTSFNILSRMELSSQMLQLKKLNQTWNQ